MRSICLGWGTEREGSCGISEIKSRVRTCFCHIRYAGKKNSEITPLLEKCVDAFGCKAVDGVVSHQIKRFTTDGTKVITNKNVPGHAVQECTFALHEAYAVDVVVSTGEGKCRELDTKCTVFKRASDQKYNLKMKTAREALYKIEQTHPKMV